MPTDFPWLPPYADNQAISFEQGLGYLQLVVRAPVPWCYTNVVVASASGRSLASIAGRLLYRGDFHRRANVSMPGQVFAVVPANGPRERSGDITKHTFLFALYESEITSCVVDTAEQGDLWRVVFSTPGWSVELSEP